MYKGLSIAEGGMIRMISILINNNTAVFMAKNASYIDSLIKQGKRYCCNDQFTYIANTDDKRVGRFQLWIPWFANENKERFPNFFPDKNLLPDK
jgi:hypothetical protein